MEIESSQQDGIAILSWNMTSASMNVLNDESIPAFERALQAAFDNPAVTGLVITSARREFVAGADLKMILRNNTNPEAIHQLSAELNRIFRSIETSGKPTVAAINGTALGGGYEICLACHHRVALNAPKSFIGLPEVTLGLLPGGGGTQRLPRLLGVEKALPLLLEGRRVGPAEALELGLVDELADTPDELMAKAMAWIRANPAPLQPWDKRKGKTIVGKEEYAVPGGGLEAPVIQSLLDIQPAGAAQTPDEQLASNAILACVQEGLPVTIDRGLTIEAQYFVQVATSEAARKRIESFFEPAGS